MADQREDARRAPGWKRDPWRRFAGRYWDGEDWTEHVVSADKVTGVDPVPLAPPPSAPPPPPPPGRPPGAAGREPVDAPSVQPAPAAERAPGSRRQRRRWPLWAKIGVPVALIIVIGAAASSGSKKNSQTSNSTVAGDQGSASTAKSSTPPAKSNYSVGETAKTGDFEVTVYGSKDPQPASQFDRPAAGSHFVSVDVQVANRGSKQQTFSSLAGFHLVDSANRQFDEEIASDVKPGPPDGQIPAGEAVRGTVVFEVPDGTTGLRLRVQGNLTASGAFFSLG